MKKNEVEYEILKAKYEELKSANEHLRFMIEKLVSVDRKPDIGSVCSVCGKIGCMQLHIISNTIQNGFEMGDILAIYEDGALVLYQNISREFGLKLDEKNRIKIEDEI